MWRCCSAALASLLRRTILGLKSAGNFLLEFMASILIALTVKLNNVSADYRYIAKKRSKQKRRLKVGIGETAARPTPVGGEDDQKCGDTSVLNNDQFGVIL